MKESAMTLQEALASRLIFLDGGMGTEFQKRGLQPGELPEDWNLIRPEAVQDVARSYARAGADILLTNTFGANRAKYHGSYSLEDVIRAGVVNARVAAQETGVWVALDIGPTGRLLKPAGDYDFDLAYDAFAEAIRMGVAAGVDLISIETMSDTYELKAALLAARETCDLPVFATVALSEDGKLLTGADVACVAALFDALKPDAVGFNCGLGPEKMRPYVEMLAQYVYAPIIVKANAGMPRVVDGHTIFDVAPEAFATDIVACVAAGASIVGGCCGTTPEHIRAVRQALEARRDERPQRTVLRQTVVSSYARAVTMTCEDSVVIGERINPTGKKKLKEAYKTGDMGYILREAVAQTDAGAPILDVNAGVPGIDESAVLRRTVEAIQSVTDAPLQIDTSDVAALDHALRHYNGKALVNSVNGKEEVMDAVFPIVKKYGGVVVALTLDENGIPATADGRVAIAEKILARGAQYGLTKEDFLIDVLCLAVSADANSVPVMLEALRKIHAMGLRSVLGVSNVSFGLPARPLLNATFYALALEAGLTAAIVNPLNVDMMAAYRAWRALTGRDVQCAQWIDHAPVMNTAALAPATSVSRSEASGALTSLTGAIVRGLKADAATEATALLAAGRTPVSVIDEEVVPALEIVGKGFEGGTVFLPQLLMAAEAARAAFDVIKNHLVAAGGDMGAAKGPIVIATVKGDIHDIGKNIVRALLENYGFKVIDLGRDVAPEAIVDAAVRAGCKLVGLSALMTTTVGFMEETIRLLNAADPEIKTFVGGAVLTQDYAERIHATWYAKDAMAGVRIAESFFANA